MIDKYDTYDIVMQIAQKCGYNVGYNFPGPHVFSLKSRISLLPKIASENMKAQRMAAPYFFLSFKFSSFE